MKINKTIHYKTNGRKIQKKTSILSSFKECKKMKLSYSSMIKVEGKVQIPLKYGFASNLNLDVHLTVIARRLKFPPMHGT